MSQAVKEIKPVVEITPQAAEELKIYLQKQGKSRVACASSSPPVVVRGFHTGWCLRTRAPTTTM